MTYRDSIIKLREKGKTYSEIVEELGCAKSTVCYYLGAEQSNKRSERQRDRRNKMRRHIAQLKSDAVCVDCKIDYAPHVLQFDHVRGVKVGNISSLTLDGNMKALLEELEKCEIVCANCHCERTYQRSLKSRESASHYLNGRG